MTRVKFSNRFEAGRLLARELRSLKPPVSESTLVLALPRGGVPVGYEIARELDLPLDIILVRKLGLPGRKEIAMGAIASGDITFLNHDLIHSQRISPSSIAEVVKQEAAELERRQNRYRGGRAPLDVTNKQVILVDDGLATGATMRAAIEAVRKQGAADVIIAVAVAPSAALREFEELGVKVVCLSTPENFYAVSLWYDEFSQTTDDEVIQLLQQKWLHKKKNNLSQAKPSSPENIC